MPRLPALHVKIIAYDEKVFKPENEIEIRNSNPESNFKIRNPIQFEIPVSGSSFVFAPPASLRIYGLCCYSYYKNKDDMLKGIVTPVKHIISENE